MLYESEVATSLGVGSVSIGTAPAPIFPVSFKSKFGFILQAPTSNGSTIHLGNCDVTTSTGFELPAGKSVRLPVEDISKLFAVATANCILIVSMAGGGFDGDIGESHIMLAPNVALAISGPDTFINWK